MLLRLADEAECPPGPRQLRREQFDAAVAQAHATSHGIYGSRKVAAKLGRDGELSPCRLTVVRSIRRQGLRSRVVRRRRPQTTQSNPNATPAPNLLDRDFTAGAPHRKWVADITYVPTDQGWVYPAVVLDLFSRGIVAWAMADQLREELVEATLHDAVKQRDVKESLLHHSDQGSQYSAADYQRMTTKWLKMTPSMSRTGDCYDNAVI